MNKQQLVSTIWQSANQMRSKIEANEYKDYILGFMFYKYLSDREISFLKGEKYSDEDIKKVTADDEKLVKHISENIGYQIIGRGVVMSDYEYDDARDDEYKNIRPSSELMAVIPRSFFSYGSYPAAVTASATASSSVYLRLLLPSTILKPS